MQQVQKRNRSIYNKCKYHITIRQKLNSYRLPFAVRANVVLYLFDMNRFIQSKLKNLDG